MDTINHDIVFTQADSYSLDITLKDITESVRLAYFTVKESYSDEPVIRKALNSGITLKEERRYKDEVVYQLIISPSDTLNLMVGFPYMYDMQFVINNVVHTPVFGFFTLTPSVSHGLKMVTDRITIQGDMIECHMGTTEPIAGVSIESDPIATRLIGNMDDLFLVKRTLVEAINMIWSVKQDIFDSNLTTTSNRIPDAINEINAKYIQYQADISSLTEQLNGLEAEVKSQENLMSMQNQMIIATDTRLNNVKTTLDDIKSFLGWR